MQFFEYAQFKNWAISGIFLYFRLFFTVYFIQLIVNKITVDRIRTVDLWSQKWPLYCTVPQPLPFLS